MPSHSRFNGDKRRRPYWRDASLLGKTFITRQSQHILIAGRDKLTRQDVVNKLHCGNFNACSNLTRIALKLNVESFADLCSYGIERLFQEPGFGLTTSFVFLCWQEAVGRDPIKYLDQKPDHAVTLSTWKHKVQHQQREQARQERSTRRKRREPLAAPA